MFTVITSGFRFGRPFLLEESRSTLDLGLGSRRSSDIIQVVLVP